MKKTEERVVSEDIIKLLPERLLQYLWKIAEQEEYAGAELHFFTLVPSPLDTEHGQSIAHQCGSKNIRKWYRLSNITPVKCCVRIDRTQRGSYMFLAQEQEKIKNICEVMT